MAEAPSAPQPEQHWRLNPESTPPAYICDYCGHWGVDRLLFAMHMQQRHDVTLPPEEETPVIVAGEPTPSTPDTDPEPDQEPLPLPDEEPVPEPEPEKEPV